MLSISIFQRTNIENCTESGNICIPTVCQGQVSSILEKISLEEPPSNNRDTQDLAESGQHGNAPMEPANKDQSPIGKTDSPRTALF